MTGPQVSTSEMVDAARAQTGLDDFGEPSWEEGLERLVDALNTEARLSEIGQVVVSSMITGHLAARLWVTEWHTRHPEIGATPVAPPIVIVGQPRTGTTILFDLLAQDRGFRVPLTWEVGSPHPPPETATYATDPRIAAAEAQGGMSEALIPGFQAIHPSGALRGQECVTITAGDFKSLLFPTTFRVPSYAEWLLHEADMSSAYRYHRQFLQLLQWRHPGERWLLKTPGHQWCLGDLFTAYPDAQIVHTHRDPLKVLASVASLTASLQRLGTDQTSIPELAAEWVEYLVVGNDRSVDARTDGTVPPGRAVDVAFGDLMADTFGTIERMYGELGLPWTAEADAAMRAFLADNPSDKHGIHTYTFSATGLDEAALRARTSRYEDHFTVPQERLG